MPDNKIIALVTGASAGLGAEFCRQLAARCDVVIGVARRQDRLDALAAEIAGVAEFHALQADLATVEGVSRTMEALRQRGPVRMLVNNAGVGSMGEFDSLSIESQRTMVSLHVDATMSLCRAAIPFMREQGGGEIVNVSSLGSLVEGRGMAVYGATKAFLNYFSLALQAELAGTGIEVQALCPGFTRTEFHDAMVSEGFDRDRIPESMWQTAEQVVEVSLAALGSGRVIVVPGAANYDMAKSGLEQQLALLD